MLEINYDYHFSKVIFGFAPENSSAPLELPCSNEHCAHVLYCCFGAKVVETAGSEPERTRACNARLFATAYSPTILGAFPRLTAVELARAWPASCRQAMAAHW